MPIYKEDPDKLECELSNNESQVEIKVDCMFGTVASLSFFHGGLKNATCGQTKDIGLASGLKGNKVKFNGAGNNPDGGLFQVQHTILVDGNKCLEYTFPTDYTGTPDYDSADEQPDYSFTVNFK